ncbi:MAG: SufD family Fe-S cluster assembly protein [Candidatus Anstonellales archaeon]
MYELILKEDSFLTSKEIANNEILDKLNSIVVPQNTNIELVIINDEPNLLKNNLNLSFYCKSNSKIKFFYLVKGISENFTHFANINFNLIEDNSEAEIYLASLLKQNSKSEINLKVVHNKKFTKSNVNASTIVFDHARAVFNGVVKIVNGAINSDAYLKDSSLMVGNDSEVISIPSMIIEENDVKAGHAATIGTIGEEEMFYMQTRGLSEKDVYNLLIDNYYQTLRRISNQVVIKKFLMDMGSIS